MGQAIHPTTQACLIPADCYNLARLARLRAGGHLQLGLSDNLLFLSASQWRCWNRRLGEDLLSWKDFRIAEREGLADPVACTLTVHHPYSRTIIHQIYDSLRARLQMEEGLLDRSGMGALLYMPLNRRKRPSGPLSWD